MTESTCQWKLRRIADGWEGSIRFPVGDLPMSVGAEGRTQREAIARAAIAAKQIAESPVMRALLPPGTTAALSAIEQLAKSPNVRATLERFAGPGARRLARALIRRW